MAGTITPICRCEEPLLIQGIYSAYCARPSRARWGTSRRNITCAAGSLLGGSQRNRACSRSYRKVRCRATALRPPYNRFSLFSPGQRTRRVVEGRWLISALYSLTHLLLVSCTVFPVSPAILLNAFRLASQDIIRSIFLYIIMIRLICMIPFCCRKGSGPDTVVVVLKWLAGWSTFHFHQRSVAYIVTSSSCIPAADRS